MIRKVLLAASGNESARAWAARVPMMDKMVDRFVAGETIPDVVGATADVTASGRLAIISFLGEWVESRGGAQRVRDEYLGLLDALAANGLTGETEISLKLSAIGQALPEDGERIAMDYAHQIAERAHGYGTSITLDMEDHTTVDSTLAVLRELRTEFPATGGVLQASLFRTEADCADFATEGSRIRLCKGSYKEPVTVAYQSRHEIDLSFVRCAKILMEGEGYPMIATHDDRIIEIAQALAIRSDRPKGSYEFQMLYGVRSAVQQTLADEGERMRVYLPYGADWYPYLLRRLAERPANSLLFVRSMRPGI